MLVTLKEFGKMSIYLWLQFYNMLVMNTSKPYIERYKYGEQGKIISIMVLK